MKPALARYLRRHEPTTSELGEILGFDRTQAGRVAKTGRTSLRSALHAEAKTSGDLVAEDFILDPADERALKAFRLYLEEQ